MIPPNSLAHNNNKSSLTLHSNTWNGTNPIHSTLGIPPESDWLRLIIFSKPIKSAKDLLKTYLTFTITCKKNSKQYHRKIRTVKAMVHWWESPQWLSLYQHLSKMVKKHLKKALLFMKTLFKVFYSWYQRRSKHDSRKQSHLRIFKIMGGSFGPNDFEIRKICQWCVQKFWKKIQRK